MDNRTRRIITALGVSSTALTAAAATAVLGSSPLHVSAAAAQPTPAGGPTADPVQRMRGIGPWPQNGGPGGGVGGSVLGISTGPATSSVSSGVQAAVAPTPNTGTGLEGGIAGFMLVGIGAGVVRRARRRA
jgi:hypothetical protein